MSSALTIAAIAVAGSVGASAVAAKSAKKSAKETNARIAAQNADQIMLDMAARGAPIYGANLPAEIQGSEAAILPYYGGRTEVDLFNNARQIWDSIQASGGTPEQKMATFKQMLEQYEPANNANRNLVFDLATGKMTEQGVIESQPVFKARLGSAEAKRNAGLEALRETLNEIDAIQAGKGYSGDSTGKRVLRFNARRAIGTQSAADLADANLQNALEERTIRSQGRDKQIAGLGLADTMARADLSRTQIPEEAMTKSYINALQPFSFFNLGTHEFTKPEPYVDMPDTTGAIASTAAGSLNTFLTNYAQGAQAKKK